jgi:hypothetical protein
MTKPTVTASSEAGESEPLPDLPMPSPQISPRYALSWPHVLLCGFFALLFALLNHLPLFHSDVWGHLLYGRWILEHGGLPAEDPFIPLAVGVRILDSAWLSQVIFAAVHDRGGPEAMSTLYAVTVMATYLLLFITFYLQTKRVGVALCGTVMVLLFASTRLLAIRPEIFGVLSFAAIILLCQLVQRPRWNKGDAIPDEPTCPGRVWAAYLGVPLLMIFWTNAHGSFPVGLVFLGCHAVGRIVEAGWRTRSFTGVFSDHMVRRWVILTQLAAVAVLVNPDTIDAYINAVTFGRNPNLRDMLEWSEMHLGASEAVWLLASLVVLVFTVRHSRVAIRPAHVLLLAVFSIALLFNVRISVWYAFVFGYVLVPHFAELIGRKWPKPAAVPDEEVVLGGGVFGRSYIHTLFCGLLLWVGFALSPSATPLLGGSPRSPERLYDRRTPLGVAAFLREHPPRGQVWNSQMWGDWLLLDGPPDLKLFVNTNAVHVVPPRVWRDYMSIARADGGWLGIADKYRVNTLIVSKDDQPRLAQRVRTLGGDWTVVYEDAQAIIVSREALAPKRKAENGGQRSEVGDRRSGESGK